MLLLFAGIHALPQQSAQTEGLADTAALPKSQAHFRDRKIFVGTVSAAVYAGSLIALNKAWYKDYPKTSFHTFNDAGEWLQVDKVGHAWTAYQTSRVTTAAWQWAGFRGKEKNKAVVIGSLTGFSYLTVIEILDAHSAKWGWSWADIGANFLGTSLFAGQEFLWDEQRIQFKFSSHRENYDGDLHTRANDLFGSSLPERILKDYNSQTYWLSFNLRSFLPKSKLPSWLNLSVGYGAEGLLGGFENLAYNSDGNIIFDRRDIPRYRQWYLAPDVDLTKIKSKSSFIRTTLALLNCLKFPAPALEFSSQGVRFKAIAF